MGEYKYEYTDFCWFKGNCTDEKKEGCSSLCSRRSEFDYLINNSGIPEGMLDKQILYPESIDLPIFEELGNIKNNIESFVEDGEFLYLWSKRTGNGKAQPLYSKILTPTGYKTMGDMAVGTEVMGEDGKPHKVIGVFPQGKKKVYELTFSDGSKCRCSDEHLWTVKYRGKWKTVTLSEIMETDLSYKQWYKKGEYYGNRWLYKIPMTKPIEFEHKEVPIDPWVMGVLLGDGCFACNGYGGVKVSLSEKDIENRVRTILSNDGFSLNKNSTKSDGIDFSIGDLRQTGNTQGLSITDGVFGSRIKQYIYDLGLFRHLSYDKFIPDVYKYNDIETRYKLLQGLVDTDGTIGVTTVYYSTSSKKLADDIVFLVQSLGGTCSCNEHEAFYTYNGERKQGLNNFELYIKMPADVLPFSSDKHRSKYKKGQFGAYRSIRNIEYIGEEECQCIMVDNPTHLYLTDNMIVTHNTAWVIKMLKTYLAMIHIGNNFKDRACFVYTPSLLLLSKQFDNPEREKLLNKLLTVDLVILDDIGAVASGNYDKTIISDIVNTRYNRKLCTLFTSNLSEEELVKSLDARIADRILSGIVLKLQGSSRRESKTSYTPKGAKS